MQRCGHKYARVVAFEIFVWPSLGGLTLALAHSVGLLALVALSFYGFIAFGVGFDVTLINGLMRRWQRSRQRW